MAVCLDIVIFINVAVRHSSRHTVSVEPFHFHPTTTSLHRSIFQYTTAFRHWNGLVYLAIFVMLDSCECRCHEARGWRDIRGGSRICGTLRGVIKLHFSPFRLSFLPFSQSGPPWFCLALHLPLLANAGGPGVSPPENVWNCTCT